MYVFFEFYLICIAVTDSSVLVLLQDNIFFVAAEAFLFEGEKDTFSVVSGCQALGLD